MKRNADNRNWTQARAEWRKILVTGRAFFILSCCSMILFLLLGFGGALQRHATASPMQGMKGLAASLSDRLFNAILVAELPRMEPNGSYTPLQAGQIASFMVRFLSDLNPKDPHSLLAAEMPGLQRERAVLLRSGRAEPDAPVDNGPLPRQGDPDADKSTGDQKSAQASNRLFPSMIGYTEQAADGQHEASGQTSPPSAKAEATNAPGSNTAQTPSPPDKPPAESPKPAQHQTATSLTDGKTVFIYHSHNRESWYPELEPGAKDANSDRINVSLVGKKMSEALESYGIGSAHSEQDYATSVKDYNWNYSYKYSLKTVQDAIADYGNLQYFFDIHRDSQRRAKTTATIDGVDYAQVYFIIGHRNPNWRENEAFANRLHERLERDYPGLSRGVWGKTAANGNGEYNQSVSPGSVLLEIGGVDNTLKECYRTAEILAEAVADLLWEQENAVEAGGRKIS